MGGLVFIWKIGDDPIEYIEIKNVKKTIDGKSILNGISLSVKQGEIMALVGPSGSGKSTLLRCINRLIDCDGGEILIDGTNIHTLHPVELRRKVGMVFQEYIMLPGTVYDNIAYGPSLLGEVDVEHIRTCMTDAGLPERFLYKDAEKLSGGEKQRVAIARAIALGPDILLMDEPTSGIDIKLLMTVEATILKLTMERKLTVIWVTHDVAQARRVGTRIANIIDGIVKQVAVPGEFEWEGAY